MTLGGGLRFPNPSAVGSQHKPTDVCFGLSGACPFTGFDERDEPARLLRLIQVVVSTSEGFESLVQFVEHVGVLGNLLEVIEVISNLFGTSLDILACLALHEVVVVGRIVDGDTWEVAFRAECDQ